MVLVEVPGDGIIGPAGRSQQDDTGAHGKPVFGLAGSTEALQFLTSPFLNGGAEEVPVLSQGVSIAVT